MDIEFDLAKRDRTLAERGLDFGDAGKVFAGHHFTAPDLRQDYPEPRFVTFGKLGWFWFGLCAARPTALSV